MTPSIPLPTPPTCVRLTTRRGKPVLVVDILFRKNDGTKGRYRRDAQVQTQEGAETEAARILDNIARVGDCVGPSIVETAFEPSTDALPYAPSVAKGTLAESLVMADLIRRGYRVSIPYSFDSPYDLVADRGGKLERLQVKSGSVVEGTLRFHCCSKRRRYTAEMIDWIVAVEVASGVCYYIPASMLGKDGRKCISLRLETAKNNQSKAINWATKFLEF